MKSLTFCILSFFVLLYGCTSKEAQKSDSSGVSVSVQGSIDAGREMYASLNEYAIKARSLSADGTITLTDNGSSQSGSFQLKSKRSDGNKRIDSLSMVVSGPFGITAAKFIGSPLEYTFYNAIEGDNYRGKPDPNMLEELTGMKGLTIEALSNVIYGLAPNLDPLNPKDSVVLRSSRRDEHFLYVKRMNLGMVEMLKLRGIPGNGSPLSLTEYHRWNSPVSISNATLPSADIAITFEGTIASDAYRLPNYIRAKSAGRELEVEYRNAKQNPNLLTVKIKMPE